MLLYDNYTGKGTYRSSNFRAFYTGAKYYKQEFDDNLSESSTYVGEFKNGRKHGQGTFSRFSYEYKGEWNEGVPHGKGEATFITPEESYAKVNVWPINSNPSEFIKQANDNLRYQYNGCKYIGGFKDGLFHGQGTMTWPDGTVQKGLWIDGEFIGE